ncbi:hypothetical protein WDZ92_11610 [Nostoc sp. NIES-2111]
MTQDEFFDFLNSRLGTVENRRFDMTDFTNVRRASPVKLARSEVVAFCRSVREWHWRMICYRLLFKLNLEDSIEAFLDLLPSEENENCAAYLMQVMEVRAIKSNSLKIYQSIREVLILQPASTQKSLLLAKLAKHTKDESLVQLILDDIQSGSCRAAALLQYRKLKEPRIGAAMS